MNQSIKKALIRATYDKRKLHREVLKWHKCAKEMECILDKMFPCEKKSHHCDEKTKHCSKNTFHRKMRKK